MMLWNNEEKIKAFYELVLPPPLSLAITKENQKSQHPLLRTDKWNF